LYKIHTYTYKTNFANRACKKTYLNWIMMEPMEILFVVFVVF